MHLGNSFSVTLMYVSDALVCTFISGYFPCVLGATHTLVHIHAPEGEIKCPWLKMLHFALTYITN